MRSPDSYALICREAASASPTIGVGFLFGGLLHSLRLVGMTALGNVVSIALTVSNRFRILAKRKTSSINKR